MKAWLVWDLISCIVLSRSAQTNRVVPRRLPWPTVLNGHVNKVIELLVFLILE